MPIPLTLDPHPLLDAAAFLSVFPDQLQTVPSPHGLLLRADAPAPLSSGDEVRVAIRDLLRHGGYKPTGRGKPASEYLVRAVSEGSLGSINAAVDTCNVVSLHSGLPISVVDWDRVHLPLRVGIAGASLSYPFNASGQAIDVSGLLCLFDATGPCANAVKDAQRTKTSPSTTRTLSILWGTMTLPDRTRRALAWYLDLVRQLGASTEVLRLT